MTDHEETELTPGWFGTIQAAAEAAMAGVPVNEPREIETISVQKKGNPLHEYKVTLRD